MKQTELIDKLIEYNKNSAFDGDVSLEIWVDMDPVGRWIKCEIDSVSFTNGNVVIEGTDIRYE